MREGDAKVKAREVAYAALRKDGCEQAAIDALAGAEASDAVWLMAAQFARDWDGPDWLDFMEPSMLFGGGDSYFIGRYVGAFPSEAERVEHDTKALRSWLRYARERIQKTERRVLVHVLASGFGDMSARRLVRKKASA